MRAGLAGFVRATGRPLSLTIAPYEVGLLPQTGGARQLPPGLHLGTRPAAAGYGAIGDPPVRLDEVQIYFWQWHCPP